MVLPSFYLHCLHMIRIVLTLHSKVIYDNEVTRSILLVIVWMRIS